MEQGQILFPELTTPVETRAKVVPFAPRQLKRTATSRLSGDGLAARLRHDVERQLAHRRRMLAHLSSQSQASLARRE